MCVSVSMSEYYKCFKPNKRTSSFNDNAWVIQINKFLWPSSALLSRILYLKTDKENSNVMFWLEYTKRTGCKRHIFQQPFSFFFFVFSLDYIWWTRKFMQLFDLQRKREFELLATVRWHRILNYAHKLCQLFSLWSSSNRFILSCAFFFLFLHSIWFELLSVFNGNSWKHCWEMNEPWIYRFSDQVLPFLTLTTFFKIFKKYIYIYKSPTIIK